jgi:hypothetical protein
LIVGKTSRISSAACASSAACGENQPWSTTSVPSTAGSWPSGAGARKKRVSKRDLLRRDPARERHERGRVVEGDARLLVQLAHGGRAMGRVVLGVGVPASVSFDDVHGAAGEHPDAAHEARLRRALDEQDLDRVRAAAEQDHARRLPRGDHRARLVQRLSGRRGVDVHRPRVP